jgi:cysteine-rich repeat protein
MSSDADVLKGCLRRALLTLLILLATTSDPMPSPARTLGMVANQLSPIDRQFTNSVTVFDADTDAVVGVVSVPGFGSFLDCSINQAQTRGYVGDAFSHVWVIDLTTLPPSLASGPNPIPISNIGEDTALTPDGRFLLACGGAYAGGIAVVDTVSQMQIGASPSGCSGVDVCRDGSVLSVGSGLRRLTIDGAGVLTETGEVGPDAYNVACAPDSQSAIGVANEFFNNVFAIRSYRIPGLTIADSRDLVGYGMSGVVSLAGDRVFVRSTLFGGTIFVPDRGTITAFGYAPSSAALSSASLFSIAPVGTALLYFGVDQLALHPNGSKLYASEQQRNRVDVYNATTGLPIASLTHPKMGQPTGICLPAGSCNHNGFIDPGEQCDDGNVVSGDGCSATCQLEACYACSGEPSNCIPVAVGTGCLDDGNECTFDRCDGAGTCTHPVVPDGTHCFGTNHDNCLNTCTAGVCSPDVVPNCCGNGVLEPGEICDDGNQASDDLCSSTCTFTLDHFQCYRGKILAAQLPISPVALSGFTAKVTRLRDLCTPASKNNEDPGIVPHPDHIGSYAIVPEPSKALDSFLPRRNVKVVNQFGTSQLDVFRPNRLFVPTAAGLRMTPTAPVSPAIDHFTCFRVRSSKGAAPFTAVPNVTVEDQFGKGLVTGRKPRRLCYPNYDNFYAAHVYLLCYHVGPRFTPIGRVFTNNEFGPGIVYPLHRDELCVPSLLAVP